MIIDKPSTLALYIAHGMLTTYKEVRYHEKNKYFSFIKPNMDYDKNYFRKGYWKKVKQQYSKPENVNIDALKEFLKQAGPLSSDKHQHYISNNNGLWGGNLGLDFELVNKALEWFTKMTFLWECAIKGNNKSIKYIKKIIKKEIPSRGFKPFLSIYDYQFLPKKKDDLIRTILQFVSEEFAKYLGNITLRPIFEKGNIVAEWRYEAKDWMDAAVIDFFLNKIAITKLCACGCGLPAKSGSKYYGNHIERVKKRKQRTKNPNIDNQRMVLHKILEGKTTIDEVAKNGEWHCNEEKNYSVSEIKEEIKKRFKNYRPTKERYKKLLKKYKETKI